MEAFREGLRFRGLPDVRSAVLDDLSSYYSIDAEECLYRATHSFELSAKEWLAKPQRETPEEIRDFYLNHQAWCFGLLWFAYLQAEGYAAPSAAIIADDLTEQPPAHVLDYGSGAGAAGMMFRLRGYRSSLADVSQPLLRFAEYRFKRRGLDATFIDLNTQSLPSATFDVAAVIQTFACVDDVPGTARELRRSLTPQGSMYGDFDVHRRTGSDGRLYDDDLPLRRAIHRTGFREARNVERATIRYHQVTPGPMEAFVSRIRDAIVLGPPRKYYRRVRSA